MLNFGSDSSSCKISKKWLDTLWVWKRTTVTMFLCHFRGCTLLHRDSWEGSSLSADHQSTVISLKRSTVLAPSGRFHNRSASSGIIIAKLTKTKWLITYRSPLTGNFVLKNRVYHSNPYAKRASKDNCNVSFLVLLFVSVCMFLSSFLFLFVLSSTDVVRSVLNKVLSHTYKKNKTKIETQEHKVTCTKKIRGWQKGRNNWLSYKSAHGKIQVKVWSCFILQMVISSFGVYWELFDFLCGIVWCDKPG